MSKTVKSGAFISALLGASALAATATDATTFTVKIANVSANDTLKVPGAAPVKAPIAPGVFLVDPAASVFAPGGAASAELQALAEDGNFEPLQKALEAKFGEADSVKLVWRPQNLIGVSGEAAGGLMKLMDALEDCDDVQNVYANYDVSADEMERLAG